LSGGSYNYLYSRNRTSISPLEGVYAHLNDLKEMKDDMMRSKPESGILLKKLYDKLTKFQENIDKEWKELAAIMRAFEWWQSGDWGEKDFDIVQEHSLNTIKNSEEKEDES
jgi:hypothetical protein